MIDTTLNWRKLVLVWYLTNN